MKFNIAEQGHIVPLYIPHDINGGDHHSPIVNMEAYSHASVLIYLGDASRAAGLITVESCNDSTPSAPTKIVFNYYEAVIAFGTADNDVLSAKKTAATTGIAPPIASVGVFYVIELDAIELDAGDIGFRIDIVNPAAACLAYGVAILSGAKYQGAESVTAII
jgi:hypothetical protein